MKDVNLSCKCFHAPNAECAADVHFKQFPTDEWSEPEEDGLEEVLISLQKDVALTDKQCIAIRDAVLKCWRPKDKTRQFMSDWMQIERFRCRISKAED